MVGRASGRSRGTKARGGGRRDEEGLNKEVGEDSQAGELGWGRMGWDRVGMKVKKVRGKRGGGGREAGGHNT
jgi:hypothetical protein